MEQLKFYPRNTYKAVEPYDTIYRIRDILKELDIFLLEMPYIRSRTELYSCRIHMGDEGITGLGLGTNGKGMTPRYALASAYGEFMERLQNNFVIPFHYILSAYRQKEISFAFDPKERYFKVGSLLETFGEEISCISGFSLAEVKSHLSEIYGDRDVICLPLDDIFEKKTIYFPASMLFMLYGSNGMCAGNTSEEALVQGICELYERYATYLIYAENQPIPMLRKEAFAGTAIYDRLENITKYGYHYDILNLSMDKLLPVVGLRLIKKEKEPKITVHIGADPCPVTALERCLTETYQGNVKDVDDRFHTGHCGLFGTVADKDVYWGEYDKNLHFGNGRWPQNAVESSGIFSNRFPVYQGESEKEYLDELLKLTKSIGKKIYIRDAGYLGFPAFHVVIPGVSNCAKESFLRVEQFVQKYERTELQSYEKPFYPYMVRILQNMELYTMR